MPWKETCAVDERIRFVQDWTGSATRGVSMSHLCRVYGISRKTGYKWIKRYNWGAQSMRDLSSRPHTHPETTDARVGARVLSQKEKFRFFGPRKIRQTMLNARLKRVPAASTIGHLLDVHGLVRKRKKRTKVEPQTQPFANCDAPNDLWCTDFKGHARMDDRRKCYPLTLMDAHTRFMFACEGLHDPNGARVKEIYERVFEEFGLPRAIRSDDSSEARIAGESSMPTTDHRLRRGHQRAFQRCRCGGSSLEFDTSASTRGSLSRTGGSRDFIALTEDIPYIRRGWMMAWRETDLVK